MTRARMVCAALLLIIGLFLPATARGASQYEAEQLYFAGQYADAAAVAREQVEAGVWNELWPELYIRCLLTQGEYDSARLVYESSLKRYGDRLAYRMLGADVYRYTGQDEDVRRELNQVETLLRSSPWRYGTSRDQMTIGRFFVERGEDARLVLELVYDRVRQQSPDFVDVYLATAELALAKEDMALAVEQLERATKLQPSNPYGYYLLALATRQQPDDASSTALRHALEINPRHVPSLLLMVDQAIDAEDYRQAQDVLDRILQINRFEPKAWAYLAVLAHLQGHYAGEAALHAVALERWRNNYEVDHLIGLKLSQKYRFREGVAYQRMALQKRADYLPAKFQLAHDLLRLGQDDEGWKLADEVQKQDGYHVVAFNLTTLHEQLQHFRTLESPHFTVRMDAREATIYGQQAVTFLEEAYETLSLKYDARPASTVYVELFPRQQDFAVRTFGLPGGAGYLGVCFGHLITANSPASQGASPTNWQSVLWHEFCHVVTLQKTANRMPRWFSEGISVYEERQRNAAWGQRLTPQFRQWMLGDELTPLSQLSGAFLHPTSAQHLQFAYFESSLAIEFLLREFGMDGLRRVLNDLAVGMSLDASLARYLGPTSELDHRFAQYARDLAQADGPSLEWQRLEDDPTSSPDDTLQRHPRNYYALMAAARHRVEKRRWEDAAAVLADILRARPQDPHAARMLALCRQGQGDANAERDAWQQLVAVDADALDAWTRLGELSRAANDWSAVQRFAQQQVNVNPLLAAGQQLLAEAAEHTGDDTTLIAAQSALLEMDPADPARAHFRLAEAWYRQGEWPRAKRHVLMALEEAPRYREAQKLLLQLTANPPEPSAPPAAVPPPDASTAATDREIGREPPPLDGKPEPRPEERQP